MSSNMHKSDIPTYKSFALVVSANQKLVILFDQDEMRNICRGSRIHYLHKLNHLDFVVPTNLQQDLYMAIIFVLLDQDEMRYFCR